MLVLVYFLEIETLGLPEPSCIQDSDLGFLFSVFRNCRPVPYSSMSRPQLWKNRGSDPLGFRGKEVGLLQKSLRFPGPQFITCTKEQTHTFYQRSHPTLKCWNSIEKKCDNGQISGRKRKC